MIRVHLRGQCVYVAAFCAPQRYCSAVASPRAVRGLAVKFLEDHKAGNMLKLDRAVVTALDIDQYKVEKLRAAVWAAAPKNRPKVIHGVGPRRSKVVDGVPYTDQNGRVEEVAHAVEDDLVGGVPLVASTDVQRGVSEHVRQHLMTDSTSNRISLWCNSGIGGSGKSTLLAHSTAAAVLELEAMVREAVGSDEAALWLHRPLGFMVTFNSMATASWSDSAFGSSRILTRIALRMLYSLAGPSKTRAMEDAADGITQQDVEAFTEFVRPFLASSLLREDAENFDDIVSAMREVLEWEGPLFLAVDSFTNPFRHVDPTALRPSLQCLCRHVLDASPVLEKNAADGTFSWASKRDERSLSLYERYCIVSVYEGVDVLKFAIESQRKLITQPMPAISVLELLRRYAQLSNTAIERLQLPTMYSQLLNPSHRLEPLSIEQYLFLTEIALTRGHPREVQRVIEAYTKKSWGIRFVLPCDEEAVEFIGASGDACLAACKLVAGLHKDGIFEDASKAARTLPFWNKHTQRQCKFTSAVPPRVLATPEFLDSIADWWSPTDDSCDDWIQEHMSRLSQWLQAQTSIDVGFVSIGALLVNVSNADGDGNGKSSANANAGEHEGHAVVPHAGDKQLSVAPTCRAREKVTELWLRAAANVFFKELTFRALALRFACLLRVVKKARTKKPKTSKVVPDEKVNRLLVNILEGVGHVAEVSSSGLKHVRLRTGALREIRVRNFPSMFNDVHAGADASFRAHTSSAADKAVKLAVKHEYGNAGDSISDLSTGLLDAIFPEDVNCEFTVKVVRKALARGGHFCFRPSNADGRGECSMFFLRAESIKPSSRRPTSVQTGSALLTRPLAQPNTCSACLRAPPACGIV